MNNRLKGVNDVSAVRAVPTMVVWEVHASGVSENSTSNNHEQVLLHSSNSLDETSEPQVNMFLLDDEDSIQLHRSALADESRSTLAEGSRSGMRRIRPSANIPTRQELESLDLDDILLFQSEEQDDLYSVVTQDSMDFEEFEVSLNDEPGPPYRSVEGSCNFYRLVLSLELGNHDSEAKDDLCTSWTNSS